VTRRLTTRRSTSVSLPTSNLPSYCCTHSDWASLHLTRTLSRAKDTHGHRDTLSGHLYLGRPSVKRTSPLPLPFFLPPPDPPAPFGSAGGVVEDEARGGVVDPLLEPEAQACCAGVLPSPVTRFSISCR
jgi:hypothetical protein